MKRKPYVTQARLGNWIIISSLLSLFLLLSPLLLVYLPGKPQADPASATYTIYIPKIAASAPIVLNVDPWSESMYKPALKRGVAHAAGSSLPGEPGMVYLFAHSSGMPWEMLGNNAPFLRLGELQVGEDITLTTKKGEVIYRVTGKKIVSPTDISFLSPTDQEKTLVLQTCWPPGTDWKRLLVFATLQK